MFTGKPQIASLKVFKVSFITSGKKYDYPHIYNKCEVLAISNAINVPKYTKELYHSLLIGCPEHFTVLVEEK